MFQDRKDAQKLNRLFASSHPINCYCYHCHANTLTPCKYDGEEEGPITYTMTFDTETETFIYTTPDDQASDEEKNE